MTGTQPTDTSWKRVVLFTLLLILTGPYCLVKATTVYLGEHQVAILMNDFTGKMELVRGGKGYHNVGFKRLVSTVEVYKTSIYVKYLDPNNPPKITAEDLRVK